MASRKRTPDPAERTEEVWAAETAFILSESLVATPGTLARRRKIIERSGRTPHPLHLMPNRIQIVWDADDDTKPRQWRPVGPPGRRPLALLPNRAYSEWLWFRGHDPASAREPIPACVGAAVLERDWPYCQICGGMVALGEQHLDHVQPYSQGGPNTVANLRLAHDICNMRRGVGN